MKTGKLSESILKRSVLGQIKNQRTEVIKGAAAGEDCAFLALQKNIIVSMETVALPVENAAYLAVMAAANNLAAGGAEPIAAMLSVTLPADAQEEQLRALMGEAESCSKDLGIQIAGGHTEVSPGVKWPVITASVTGRAEQQWGQVPLKNAGKMFQRDLQEGMESPKPDIVMSKWIGLEGTFILAKEKEKELLQRYPVRLVSLAKEQGKWLSVASEAGTALAWGVYAMHDVRSGGIFGALWELSQKTGLGFCVDLKRIPVKQETIEVCEFFGLNPYELLSGGALLMLTEDGDGLVRALAEAGISSAVIGSANFSNDKIVRNGEETRYLGPAQQDEIYKVIGKGGEE